MGAGKSAEGNAGSSFRGKRVDVCAALKLPSDSYPNCWLLLHIRYKTSLFALRTAGRALWLDFMLKPMFTGGEQSLRAVHIKSCKIFCGGCSVLCKLVCFRPFCW